MTSRGLTNEEIHKIFKSGGGARLAEQVFQDTLKGFAHQGLLLRQKVNVTKNVFSSLNSQGDSEIHSIYQYRLDYIGLSTALVVYRLEGQSTTRNAFALFNDMTSLYQPISTQKLIELLQKSRNLESTLEDVVIRTNEAHKRIQATGRSMEAK